LFVLLPALEAAAGSTDGLVLRTLGFYKGRESISEGQIECEIPTTTTAIADGSFNIGLWNTYGTNTLFFPDRNNPFGNPCGGYIQLQNNLVFDGITVDAVVLRYKVAGARRFRAQVPTFQGFPTACRELRRTRSAAGTRLAPIGSDVPPSGSGAPNTGFVQLLPFVSPNLIYCLRSQYSPVDPNLLSSIDLVVKAYAVGVSDHHERYRSNVVNYHLTLRHTCGNGRVDDGEDCDPAALGNTCIGTCAGANPTSGVLGTCSNSGFACSTAADCTGTCVAQGNPSECACLY
jgi:hypothetical protein